MILNTSSLNGTSTACGMITVSADPAECKLVEKGSKERSDLLETLETLDGFEVFDETLFWFRTSENGFLDVRSTSGVVWGGTSGLFGMLMFFDAFWLSGFGGLATMLFSGAFRLSLEDPALLWFLQKSLSRTWYHISDDGKDKKRLDEFVL